MIRSCKCQIKSKAMAASYKRMLQLLEKWPIDKNKTGQ